MTSGKFIVKAYSTRLQSDNKTPYYHNSNIYIRDIRSNDLSFEWTNVRESAMQFDTYERAESAINEERTRDIKSNRTDWVYNIVYFVFI